MGPELITTVMTAAESYDLTTLAIVKDELSIKDGASNTILQRYLTSASAAATQYCNRVFQAETIKDEFWAQRDRSPRVVTSRIELLQLSRWPIVSVTSVTENAVALVDGTDFRVDYANGQLIRLGTNGYPRHWPVYPIAVVYVGGYATIPTDVADAVIRMVRGRWNARGRDPMTRQIAIPGVIEQQFWVPTGADGGNMPPDVSDILDNYRVPIVAA